MRVSNNTIHNAGLTTLNRQWAELMRLQQQVSSGRRVVSPGDDPIAAARALEVSQARDVNALYADNINAANTSLSLEESQLTSAGDLLTRIRELAVQGGNPALTKDDRKALAMELRARFDELVGIANATDGTGQYLFSGYMGSTKPFAGSVDGLNQSASNEITYAGDDGQRRIQVSASRELEVSDSGRSVFSLIPNGNGYFVTDVDNSNGGTAVIDGGNVMNPNTWNALTNKDYQLKFWVDNTASPPVTYYDIIDTTANASLITGGAPESPPTFPGSGLRQYLSGQPIQLSTQSGDAGPSFDLGSSVIVAGEPADGDGFTLKPSTTQSMFKTVATLVSTLENTVTSNSTGSTVIANKIGFALTNLTQATDNLLRVRAAIGSRMGESESLANVNGDVDLQYQQTLAQLQDLDYAKAISELSRKQVDLQAAQQSFASVSQLSLFKYI